MKPQQETEYVSCAVEELQRACDHWEKLETQTTRPARNLTDWEKGYYDGRKATYRVCGYQVRNVLREISKAEPSVKT